MTFVLPKLLEILARPSMLLLLCALLGLILGRGRFALACIAALLAIVVLPVGQWVARPLEDRLVRPDPPPAHADGIIVLGGAVEEDIFADRGLPGMNASAERMTEAVALSRRYPDARLVFSGGSGRIIPEAAKEADVARAFWRSLGVADDRVIYEDLSRTTWENVHLTKAQVAPKSGESWLLVTSALHMPRSVAVFCAAGWAVTPWPTSYTTLPHRWRWIEAPGQRLGELDGALHEWVGLLAYRLQGRTRDLLPAPGDCGA